ncbi:MAG: DNA mismatch repair protein, partial [candidate division Zixibacteria bacterium]|nr:DNA mismatch repair protein [candidate division Zixibacteria bacterium]
IYFENIREGIRNRPDYLKKLIALYFRFSLLDNSFAIFLNDEKITTEHLKDLGQKTQFLWKINDYDDPYIRDQLSNLKEQKTINVEGGFSGFIASVEKPRDLKVISTEERVSIDLFTNGRLREKDILKYIPSARIVENYLYGQIHYNGLDDEEKDRFSSSREGIVANDPKFMELLKSLKDNVLSKIIEDWDIWRSDQRQPGDPDNSRMTEKERRSVDLYNSVSGEYTSPEGSKNKEKVDKWIKELVGDAKYNFGSYADCFISENLIRKYVDQEGVKLSKEAERDIKDWRKKEKKNKKSGNCNIDIRQNDSDVSYLDMAGLANLVDKQPSSQNCLPTDAKEYRPIRDALMHTALLTNEAKTKLTSVYNNIKGRVKTLLSI